jgi:hypothetical protein
MFSRTDKKSMIIQALMVSPELMEIVYEGIDDFSRISDVSKDLVQECIDKVVEIQKGRIKSSPPPPIPYECEDKTPTVMDRFLNRIKR